MGNPCPGYKITTPYGRKGGWMAGYHTGDDYGARFGSRVVASRDGRVVHVGWGGWGFAYGAHVIIDHGNGIRSMYAHLSRTTVRVGTFVDEGDLVGRIGSTGNSTGPHLHYEERRRPFGYWRHRKPVYNRKSKIKYPTYLSKLKYGTRDSRSVKNLQAALNKHPMPGGRRLPVSGYYGPLTDAEVRRCQRKHGFGDDPRRKSYVGIRQAKHLKLPKIRR